LRGPAEQAAVLALEAGCRLFQYRDKINSRRTIYDTTMRLSGVLRRAGAVLIVNDHADIARAVDADGVHLGQDDLPVADARKIIGADRLIGLSTHDREQAVAAEAGGADYIGFGPLFPTGTKDAGPARGTADLAAVTASVTVPVIAIGGITAANAARALSEGAAGVAVISAVLGAADLGQAVRQFVSVMQSKSKEKRDL